MSAERRRENFTDPAATGLRYFQLYEKMPATGGALAYPCKWNGTTETWNANTTATKVTIYPSPVSTVGSLDGASSGDFMACIYMARSRRWEIIGRWEDWGWARLVSDLNALSSTTATVWCDTSVSNTMVNTTVVITVHDRLLTAGAAIATLTRVRWVLNPRTAKRYVVSAACEVDTSSTVWGT